MCDPLKTDRPNPCEYSHVPMPEVTLQQCTEHALLLAIHTEPRGVTEGVKNKILSCLRGAYPTRVKEHNIYLGDGKYSFMFTVLKKWETLTGFERFVIHEVVQALKQHKRTSNIRACHNTEEHTGRIVFDFM